MSRPLSGAPPGKVKAGPHGKDRPSEKNIDHHADGTIIGPYGAAAAEYWDAGWRGVLPLPARRKKEPPDGYTGRTGAWPSRADIQAWTEDGHADGNIALRMPDNVIGVDVDCYDGKPGATTLTRLVAECGPLPATWASTSRSDGSGIRFYRVPPGMSWPGVLGPGIEIIQHVHRYAVVSPSIHPEGRLYSWVSPDGVRTTVIPQPDDLTQLPEPWVAGMTSPSSGGTAPGWTDPDLDQLVDHGVAAGVNQDDVLRDVVWKLRGQYVARSATRAVWDAIVAKTTLTKPEPWTGKDFERHWSGADKKIPPPPTVIGDGTSRSSWAPVDLAPILDGTRPRLPPTILTRTDGQGLWYPGRTHALVGESESAKSWLAQYGCAQQLLAGHNVVYLDFEDSAEAVTDRMLILGMTPELLRARFGYIAPEEPVDPAGRGPLTQALGDLRPTLVVIDGVTEAMAMHRLKSVDNDDLATFGRIITRPIAATGAAAVNLDHQPKATDNRGRYALGGVHKLNGMSGVSIIAENIAPMGVGLRGVTRLRIAKDRPGQLRAHGLPSAGLRWIGDFILDTSILIEPALIRPPVEVAKADEWRPTEVMRKVCDAMTKAGKPLSQKDVLDRVKARANITRRALAILVDEKFIDQDRGPHNAQLHTLVTPYRDDE